MRALLSVDSRVHLIAAGLFAVGLVLLACSSGGGTPISTGSGASPVGADGTSACGLAFYPGDYDKSCQTALDQACCSEEKSCAANPDCPKLIDCINACPPPRQDACVNACAGGSTAAPGYTEFAAIADCSKRPAYKEPPGVRCGYP